MAREMTPQERAAAIAEQIVKALDVYPSPINIDAVLPWVKETRRAALLEINRRLLPNAQSAMLDAPCLWCGYNGEGYWQPTTHELTCPWHNVGGRFDRVVALDRLAQEG